MTTKSTKNYKQNLGNLPIWDLSDLYDSIESKQIYFDLKIINKEIKKFQINYEGKINLLNAKDLLKAIQKYEIISERMDKILSYAHLILAENIENIKNKIFFQQMHEKINNFSSSLIFFTLELNKINNNKLKKLLKFKGLQKYKTWIEISRNYKKHQLEKNLEKLIREKSLTSSSAWIRLFDETIASLRFPYKKNDLSSSEILSLLSDKSAANRKHAAKSIGIIFEKNINIFTTITNTLAKDKAINDKWRNFSNPIRSRNLSNVVEDEVVNTLSKVVIDSYPRLSHRYYKLKAKWFNQKNLKYWDRNAPLPFQSNRNYTWNNATSIILDSFREFNLEFGGIARKFFKQKWIHAKVSKGKSPGAFSASTVPSAHPYILLNYQGKVRDVSTLAHELGHGIHQFLAGQKQGYFNSSTPLTLAETASVFGEMLTFNFLLKQEKNLIERKAILANKIEDMLNTVVRQIAFFEFEKIIHDKRKESEIKADEICNIWLETQSKSLGPAIKFEKEYKYYWMYIPHFIHSPFYVYAYAFGDCLVNSLFSIYEENPNGFDKKYLELLEAGGSLKYKELLKPFNLDPSKKYFWNKGISVIESYIDELENISQ